MNNTKLCCRLFLSAGSTLIVLSCIGYCNPTQARGTYPKPIFVTGPIIEGFYDGKTNDLLTGGIGRCGLACEASTPDKDLRVRTIATNYRALIDTSKSGGFGSLYGPSLDPKSKGLIAGMEFITFADDGSGRKNVTMMVQVPKTFDPANSCLIAAPSSGSRGVYGAIGTAGEWGLKHGCAVAYTDKGTGTGAHNLMANTVGLIAGERANAVSAGKTSTFTADITADELRDFNKPNAFPNRFAFKHAHSQQNPEADWGRNVLDAIDFAFYVLNHRYCGGAKATVCQSQITPANTHVIASSISNGGGASVRAAEIDDRGLIDAVVVSEPNVNPVYSPKFKIVQGSSAPLTMHSRSLFDYVTLINVYQGCANTASVLDAPLNDLNDQELGKARCASLKAKNLLQGDDLAEQAREAQSTINDYGIHSNQNNLQPSRWLFSIPQAISVTYANAYAKARVIDNLCGYSFAAIDQSGRPTRINPTVEAELFAMSTGIPPLPGHAITLINNHSADGPMQNSRSRSKSTGLADQNLDGALCLRSLATGVDPETNLPLTGARKAYSEEIKRSIEAVRASGDLKGKPTLIVTGRADAVLAVNHTSRAYFGLNRVKEGSDSRLRYYEVLNAHHLDAFNNEDSFNNMFAKFAERYIPLHYYFDQAMTMMYDHLTKGTPLPPSQVVRTRPRDTGAPHIKVDENLPAIVQSPAESDRISFVEGELRIPE